MLEFERAAPNGVSQASGVFSNCGPGVNTYELQYHCKGPACSSINGFQNVKCNQDGGSMTCSNDVKCPSGISSYMSNFTFTQNDGDPWKPSSQNERDSRVQQQQLISLPSCAKFSLTSDGTKAGTKVDDGGKADEKQCPKVRETPSPTAGAGLAKKTSSTSRSQTSATGRPVAPAVQGSYASRRSTPKNVLFVTFLIGLMMLLPGTNASSTHDRKAELRRRAELRVRDVSDKLKAFAQDFNVDLAEKANAQGQNGDVFAHNLVADVVSSVCDSYFGGQDPGTFTPIVVEDCVKSIYGGERLPQAAGQFFAVFGASLLCDYAVSEAYPVAAEFFPDGCEGLQELANKISPKASAAPSPASNAAPTPLPASNQASNAPPSAPPQTNAQPSDTPPNANTPPASPPAPTPALPTPPPASPSAPEQPESDPVIRESATALQTDAQSQPVPAPSDSPAPLSPPADSPLPTPPVSESQEVASRPSPPELPSRTPDPTLRTPLPSERERSSERPSVESSPAPRPSESGPVPSTPSPEIPSITPPTEEPSATPPLRSPPSITPPIESPQSPSPPARSPPSISPPIESPSSPSPPARSPPSPSSPAENSPTPSRPVESPPSSASRPSRPPVTPPSEPPTPSPSSPTGPRTPPTRSSTPVTTPPPITNSTTPPPTSTPTCQPSSDFPDFCPGVGCVDLHTNKSHCGKCNNTCEYSCNDGVCTCEDGSLPNNNGTCVPKCVNGTVPSTNGTCVPTCEGKNIDFDFDNAHCGGCNKECKYKCHEGLCRCPDPGLSVPGPDNNFCNTTTREPACPKDTDFMTNNMHCGACNQTCVHECYGGKCLCPVSHSLPGSKNNCTMTPETCPEGQYPMNQDYCCTKNPTGWGLDGAASFDDWKSKYCMCGNGRHPADPRGCTGATCPSPYVHDTKYDKCCQQGTSWNPESKNCTKIPNSNCPKGFEFWEDYDLCCPAGASDVGSDCVCPNGQTLNSDHVCSDSPNFCPQNYTMDEKYKKCCPNGTVWNNDSKNCTNNDPICLEGQYLDEKYKKCCPTGLVWNDNSKNCTSGPITCLEGQYLDVKYQKCCPTGLVWNNDSKNCTNNDPICLEGQYLDEKYKKCCPTGLVWNDNSKNCTSGPITCLEGQYLDVKYQKCCPTSLVWNDDSKNCTSAPIICPEGQVLDDKYKKCCPKDTVWDNVHQNCTAPPNTCPTGFSPMQGLCCRKPSLENSVRRASPNPPGLEYYYCVCANGRGFDNYKECTSKPDDTCPDGEVLDEKYKKCCPTGTRWNQRRQECIATPPTCPQKTQVYDPESGYCCRMAHKRQLSEDYYRRQCTCLDGRAIDPVTGCDGTSGGSVTPSVISSTSVVIPSSDVGRRPAPSSTSLAVVTPPPASSTTPPLVSGPSSIVLPSPPTPPTPSSTPSELACALPKPDKCFGACVDTKTDLNNCGSCGTICTGVCVDGACGTVITGPGAVVQPSSSGVAMPTGIGKFIIKGLDKWEY
ncbi:hypothetical protein BKA66DRAFT_604108 [Pyrenochaeta sp. MPI-SDFR-AT-0127]|nr:hypothetical protein BKA66DRAFT_604108 [Pyrenochaeta sp. MPI-SDFR-AT-0127]